MLQPLLLVLSQGAFSKRLELLLIDMYMASTLWRDCSLLCSSSLVNAA